MLENKIRKFVLRKGLLPGSPFLFSTAIQYFIIVVCLLYILLRAIRIPITHDEAGTILNFSSQSIWNIITYRDPIPNNHILNTLLIRLSTSVFGFNELSCRLPNILGGLIYLLCSLKLSQVFFEKPLLRLSFQILLIANPFIIEFFALARGYGLSVGLMMVSIYFLLQKKQSSLLTALAFAATGMYTNITQLNYLMPLIFVIMYLTIQLNLVSWLFISKSIMIILSLGALLALPIIKMMKTDQFVYWGNTGFWNETLIPLLKSSLQGEGYFSQSTVQVFITMIILSILYSTIKTAHLLFIKNYKYADAVILNIIFLGAIFYNLLQNYVFNIPFLNARTSIFFYPLFVLAISSSVAAVETNLIKRILFVLYGIAGGFGLVHITRTYNLHSSYEWWYDGDNKKVISRLLQSEVVKPIRLKCNWLFQPSMTFYTKGQNQKLILPPPYQKSIDTSELVDFYYITSDDMNDWFKQNYYIDTSFAWNSRYLMRKK